MWERHLWNLLSRSWANLLSNLSTSTLAVAIFSFAVPVLIFASLVTRNILQFRRSGRATKEILKGTAMPSLIGALITMCAWACLFGWSIAATIYGDHQVLVSRVPEVREEQASLDDKVIDSQKLEIGRLKKLIPKFNPQCWMQSIPLPAPKNPADALAASEAIIVCNTELRAPITFDISYDQRISGVYFPVVVPDTLGRWGFVETRDKSLSATLVQGLVEPYKAFVVAVNTTSSKPPVATKIRFR